MNDRKIIGRRNFLKLVGTSLLALPFNFISSAYAKEEQPVITWDEIPATLKVIFQRITKMEINRDGYLGIWDKGLQEFQQAQIIQTQWNIERNNSFERLFPDKAWGIVLHWFGATFFGEDSLASYLRGFDGLRQVGDYQTRTSAHFLVGDSIPASLESHLGILQTQYPDVDGTPLVASHLSGLDYQAHENKDQYFVRAFYQLGYDDTSVKSILTELYDGPRLDPNYRTIAVEMTGANFDKFGNEPAEQEIANVVSLIYALMMRYKISALNILGHHEIELRKSDPGKKFMALIRFLMGLYALYLGDPEFFKLVFGEFISNNQDPWLGVMRYFKFIRDYQVAVDYPDQVYLWEAKVNYWNFYEKLAQKTLYHTKIIHPFEQFLIPIKQQVISKKETFLSPPDQEGVDLYLAVNDDVYNPMRKIDVLLPADGECMCAGYKLGYGYFAFFKHIQKNGAAIISIFSNLDTIKTLKNGFIYNVGYQIGKISAGSVMGEGYLHMAIAYGATWETVLQNRKNNPPGVTSEWIKRRYIDPVEYFLNWQAVSYPDQLAD